MVHRNLGGGNDRFLFDRHTAVNETRVVKDRLASAAESPPDELETPPVTETQARPRKGGMNTNGFAKGLRDMGYLRRLAPSGIHSPVCFGWTSETPIIASGSASQIQIEWLSAKSNMPHPTPASVTTYAAWLANTGPARLIRNTNKK